MTGRGGQVRPTRPLGPIRLTSVATLSSISVALPAFLIGATGVLLRDTLGFDESFIGFTIGASFLVSALVSVSAGRWSDTVGPRRVLLAGTGLAALSLVGISLGVFAAPALLVFAIVAGAGNGVLLPAVSSALAQGVQRRRALMFGIKQSGPPFATLLAGVALPLLSERIGWRPTFLVGAVVPIAAVIALARTLPPGPLATPAARETGADGVEVRPVLARRALFMLAFAIGCGTAAAMSPAAFLVPSAAAIGMSTAEAGWVLAVGGLSAAMTRLLVGWIADLRRSLTMHMSAVMMLLGTGGFVLLSMGTPLTTWVGAVLAYGGAWGCAGLLIFAAVQSHQDATGVAAGAVQAGGAMGAAIGPVAFGLIVRQVSYEAAWLAAGALTLSAAIMIEAARAGLISHRRRTAAS